MESRFFFKSNEDLLKPESAQVFQDFLGLYYSLGIT